MRRAPGGVLRCGRVGICGRPGGGRGDRVAGIGDQGAVGYTRRRSGPGLVRVVVVQVEAGIDLEQGVRPRVDHVGVHADVGLPDDYPAATGDEQILLVGVGSVGARTGRSQRDDAIRPAVDDCRHRCGAYAPVRLAKDASEGEPEGWLPNGNLHRLLGCVGAIHAAGRRCPDSDDITSARERAASGALAVGLAGQGAWHPGRSELVNQNCHRIDARPLLLGNAR